MPLLSRSSLPLHHAPPSLKAFAYWVRWVATQTNPGRTLVATAVLWLTVFGICKEHLWRDPHSAYFQDATVYDLGYSALRQAEARDFISDAEQHQRGSDHETRPLPLICAAMTTFKRHERQYLNESLGSLLVGLTPEERDVLDARVLFAHSDPTIHPDWDAQWLQTLDSWGGYNMSQEELASLRQLEADEGFQTKGIIDYTYLLDACLSSTDAPYIAMFEDDIIFAEGWLLRTLSALEELASRSTNWLYLRLFYTETALFWDPQTDYWYGHLPLTFGLATTITFASLMLMRTTVRPTRQYLDGLTVLIIALVTVPAFVALYFMAGKYNVMPLEGLERMDRGGCCTQALIFPREQVPALITMLRERDTGQTDLLVEEYADNEGLGRFALAPQVVQHVGLISSRGSNALSNKSTWAFWFEAYRKEKLRKEHDRLAASGIVERLRHRSTQHQGRR